MPTTQNIQFYIPLLVTAIVAALIVAYFLFIRKPALKGQQAQNAQIFLFFSLGLALFAGGLWAGDRLNVSSSIVVEPSSEAMQPFWRVQAFDFEGGTDEWEADAACGTATLKAESDPLQAYSGSGFLRLTVDLKSPGEDEAIALEQMACLKYSPIDAQKLSLTDGVIGYIKVMPTLDTLGNTFQAEYQVRGMSGEEEHWSKARYPLKVGEWTPIVWTKPSWLQAAGTQVFFPPIADGVWITVWADRGFKGDILVDGITFYMLQRR